MSHFAPLRLLSLIVVAAILFAALGRERVQTAPPNESKAKITATPRLVGSASCAAAACHGGLGGQPIVGAEYSIWSQRDPHSRAYSVLLNDLSQQMAKRLELKQPAHESAVCLNCHSPVTTTAEKAVMQSAPVREQHLIEGVSCEHCHGPAEHWLTAHVRKDWKPRSTDERLRLGYRDLTDVLSRANLCVDCHVGGPGRDVNHDLIAAGHPRLFFELSAFHANWPKHWPSELVGRAPLPDHTSPTRKRGVEETGNGNQGTRSEQRASSFEAKLWAVGQVVTAQRSLELLSQRAAHADANPSANWPELAEWNCFACHHDLQAGSWRQARGPLANVSRVKDSFVGNAWPYALIEPLAITTNHAELVGEKSLWQPLRSLIAKSAPPPVPIQKQALMIAAELRAWAKDLNHRDTAEQHFSAAAIDKLQLSLLGDVGAKLVAQDWDSATQLMLALTSLHHASIALRTATTPVDEQRDREIHAVIDSMNETLNFPLGFQSPRDFADKPIERLQTDLLRLRKLLTSPK